MTAPRVLVLLSTSASWSRGILRGFVPFANERGWNLLQYDPNTDLEWLAREWRPAVVVVGPERHGQWPAAWRASETVSVNADRTADNVASVCLNEEQIANVALEHLLSKGLANLTAFRFDASPFAVVREQAFLQGAAASGARLVDAWWKPGAVPSGAHEDPAAIAAWLVHLPKPCGIFTCCDSWSRVVVRYARTADLRVPDDVAIVGVDNDVLECEVMTPPLSSVMVPWQNVGRQGAQLVQLALSGQAIAGQRIVVGPGHVIVRRSSDALAVDDPLVARAIRWIREHADQTVTVPTLAHAMSTNRRRLERRFHAVLGRTVMEELRRARVETAKYLLSTTRHNLTHIAKLSGFTTAALLSVAFRRELGLPPGAYRRRVRETTPDE